MRAIVRSRHGGPEVLEVTELPDPDPAAGEVLIQVKAFGLNHADTYMRSGVWSFGVDVLGIECAGVVLDDPGGELAAGTAVVALVGGLARTRNGSYAERVTVPRTNVVPVRTALGWAELAAIPEAYATAWVALHANLALRPGNTLLVRGATSSLGRAAVDLAVDHGARVLATTRSAAREPLLRGLGVHDVLVDDGELAARLDGGVECVLDLVGNRVLRDSLRCARPRGRVCQLGFLGGLDPVADFNPLLDLPSGVQLSTFASAFALGEPAYPLDEVPLQAIVEKVERGELHARPARVFGFDDIVEAHRLLDGGAAGGKLVVSLA